jgi:hypothetical protein
MLRFAMTLSAFLIVGVSWTFAQTPEFLCGAEATQRNLRGGTPQRAQYIRDCLNRKQKGNITEPQYGARPKTAPNQKGSPK